MDISLALLPHQLEAVQSQARYLALTGGYGSGKTMTSAALAVMHCAVDQGMPHGLVSPNFPQAKKTTIPAVFSLLEDNFGFREGRQFKFNRVDHEFRFKAWRSQLYIMSGDNPNSLKGSNLGSCGIDEPGIMSHDVLKQVEARIRHPKAKWPQIYLTGTPEDLNWYADFVEGDKKPTGLHDIRAKTRDNIFLSEEYFRSLEESYSAEEIQAYMLGQFVNLNGSMAAHAFSNANLIAESEYKLDPQLPILVGFDYNWSPNVAVIAQEVPDWIEGEGDAADFRTRLIVFDEVWANNCSTEKKCEFIIEKFGREATYHIYQDATADGRHSHGVGVSDTAIVRNSFAGTNHRLFYNSTNPMRKDRMNAVNGRLCNGLGERFIYITKNCKHLIDDLRRCKRDEFIMDNYKDPDRGHIMDALGYMVAYRYPIKRITEHSNRLVKV